MQIIGTNFTSYVLSEYQDDFYLFFNNLKNDNTIDFKNDLTKHNIELKIKRNNEESIFVQISCRIQKNTLDNSLLIYSNITDINNLKRIETALKKSEELYKNLTNQLPVGVYRSNRKGEFLFANKKFLEILDIESVDELKNLSAHQFYFDPLLRETKLEEWKNNLDGFSSELKLNTKSGTEIWVRDSGSIILNEKGEIDYLSGIIEDITEAKLAQEILIESEEKFRIIAEQSLMAIAILQDGKFIYANNALSNMLEYNINEIYNWKEFEYSKAIHPDDLYFVMNQSVKKQNAISGTIPHYTFRGITKSGRIKWFELFSKTINYQSKICNLFTLIDITEKNNAQQALIESEERFRRIAENSPAIIYRINFNPKPHFEYIRGCNVLVRTVA